MRSRFTEQDKQFIQDNFQTMTDREIGEAIGHSELSISNKRLSMELLHKQYAAPLSDAEKTYVESRRDAMTIKDIAKHLHRGKASVSRYLRGRDAGEIQQATKIPFPRDWRPSYVIAPSDPDLIAAVDLQRVLCGTYSR